jgi:hypothetical protein
MKKKKKGEGREKQRKEKKYLGTYLDNDLPNVKGMLQLEL